MPVRRLLCDLNILRNSVWGFDRIFSDPMLGYANATQPNCLTIALQQSRLVPILHASPTMQAFARRSDEFTLLSIGCWVGEFREWDERWLRLDGKFQGVGHS